MLHQLATKVFRILIIFLFVSGGALAKGPPDTVVLPDGEYRPLLKVSEDPSKRIPVQAFELDVYPVTNLEFLQFVKNHPKWKKSNVLSLFAGSEYLQLWEGDKKLGSKSNPKAPVVFVSWFAAKAYCQAQGKTLPTEAQWEYAASASEKKKYAAYDDGAFQRQILNWYGEPTKHPLPDIGQKNKNLFGIYDLHGLVWEWVLDFNNAMVTGESRGDRALEKNLFCGSGASGSVDPGDYATFMRYAFRSSLKANYVVSNLGFRCAKEKK
ncbi:MAG: formylglycine-generating enzyme family protein [Bdellovibrionales bacterium]|nr:formylglycine-generating enzyme family protein [Bdellovibrionales bacterium]